MIDLSYKKPEKKGENEEFHPCVQYIIMAVFAAFMAYMILSGIAGEPLFQLIKGVNKWKTTE